MFRTTFNIVFLCLLASILAKNCVFKYDEDFPDKEPVLLWPGSKGRDLIVPENDAVIIYANEMISVACPGATNSLINVDSNPVEAKCVGGQTLKIGNWNYKLDDLGCSTSVTGEFMLGKEQCGNTGVIKHIGHSVEDDFNILFNICYDDYIGGTLYADHVIYGAAINFSGSAGGRPSFKVAGVAPGVSADNSYKQVTQKKTFAKLLGSVKLAEKYIYPNSYLARGHLAPDKDMIYVSSQWSTYFYINTVPQWQQINNGNWKSLETSLRNVAARLQENFQVISGSYDVLQLPDINNNYVEIFLSDRMLPVPKFVWKVFYSLETNKAIAFVNVNNPFVSTVTSDLFLCKDICDQYGWGTSHWKNPAKGLLYCCEVDDLRQSVSHVPQLEISGVQGSEDFKQICVKNIIKTMKEILSSN